MKPITAEVVRGLYADLPAQFGATVEQKAQAEVMLVCADLLDALSIQKKATFLGGAVTTLPKLTGGGATIYVPYEPGSAAPAWPLEWQAVVVIHECVHAVQIKRMGALSFSLSYLVDAWARATLEAEGYACAVEYAAMRGIVSPTSGFPATDPDNLSRFLVGYGCDDNQIAAAKAIIATRAAVIARGALVSEPAIYARGWLAAHAPDLLVEPYKVF